LVWLDGGLSQLESWDPKPGTRFGGPFRSIPSAVSGIRISELMPQTARHTNKLALIRNLCTQDNSHSAGVARIQRGDPKNRGVDYPYLNVASARWLGPKAAELPASMVIKPGNGGFLVNETGFLGPRHAALALGDGKPPALLDRPADLAAAEDDLRLSLRDTLDRMGATARGSSLALANTETFKLAETLRRRRDLFDPARLSRNDIERYGDTDLGRHLLQARGLLEAGVRSVKVISYGWDSHGDHFNGSMSLMPQFDRGLSALLDDLGNRGMLDHVLVVVLSEFGRTPRINGHLGRDHWPEAWSAAMAGAGIVPGQVVGETVADGSEIKGNSCDIGHLFHTIFHALGISTSAIHYEQSGQPLPLAHEGMYPIKAMLRKPPENAR
jgi:uncharacterized protein (DUF1501 family)